MINRKSVITHRPRKMIEHFQYPGCPLKDFRMAHTVPPWKDCGWSHSLCCPTQHALLQHSLHFNLLMGQQHQRSSCPVNGGGWSSEITCWSQGGSLQRGFWATYFLTTQGLVPWQDTVIKRSCWASEDELVMCSWWKQAIHTHIVNTRACYVQWFVYCRNSCCKSKSKTHTIVLGSPSLPQVAPGRF